MTGTDIDPRATGPLSAEISNLAVRLMSEYTGRGPTRARTYLFDDLVTIVLQDTLTKGELSLVRDGKTDLVLTTRRAFQMTMRSEFVAGVEELTGRHVMAFLSDNHVEPDVAVETFLLSPPADESS